MCADPGAVLERPLADLPRPGVATKRVPGTLWSNSQTKEEEEDEEEEEEEEKKEEEGNR